MENCFPNLVWSLWVPGDIFGLANVPSLFQNFINNILHGILDKFCTTYIDDILIYSNFKKKHQTHVQKVLAAFQKAGL